MATLITRATGDFLNANTWGVSDSTFLADSEASNASVTTSFLGANGVTPGAITIDALGVKILSKVETPSCTFTIQLYNSTDSVIVSGANITVNQSDLPNSGWMFFKTNGDITLTAGKTYYTRVSASVTSVITLYRSAASSGFWTRQLRTTTTAVPAANDTLHVAGELTGPGTSNAFTLTMNNTATTSFGSLTYPQSLTVSKGGTVTWATSANTTFYLRIKGIVFIYDQGVWNQGTSTARTPLSTFAILEFNPTTNVDSGVTITSGGIFRSYGDNSCTINRTYLPYTTFNSDTTVSAADITGWQVNDDVAFITNTRVNTQHTQRKITGILSNTVFTVTGVGINISYDNQNPNALLRLSRNNKIRGTTASTGQGYILAGTSSVLEIDNTEMSMLGSSTTNKRGIDIASNQNCFITNSSIWNCTASSNIAINLGTAVINTTISGCNLYNYNAFGISTTAGTTSRNWIIHDNHVAASGNGGVAYSINDVGGRFTNNVATNTDSTAFNVSESNQPLGTFTGNLAWANNGSAFSFAGLLSGLVQDCRAWRNVVTGIIMNSGSCTFDSISAWGNGTACFSIAGGYSKWYNVKTWSGTTYTSPLAVTISNFSSFEFSNSTFGYQGLSFHTNSPINFGTFALCIGSFTNCVFYSTNDFATSTQTSLNPGSQVSLINPTFSYVPNKNYLISRYGTSVTDTTIYNSTSPSLCAAPLNATFTYETSPINVAVLSGYSYTPSIKVRHSVSGDGAAYNGSTRARLRARSNPAVGIMGDLTLATATSASDGAWETISGTIPTLTADGMIELYVDCIGTAGWVNIDSFTPPTAVNTKQFGIWGTGEAFVVGDNSTGGGTVVTPAFGMLCG